MKIMKLAIILIITRIIHYFINWDYNIFSDGFDIKKLLLDTALFAAVYCIVEFVSQKIRNRKSSPDTVS